MSFRNGMPGLHLFPALQVRERKMTTVYVGSILVKPIGKIASRHSWGNAQRCAACAAALWGKDSSWEGAARKPLCQLYSLPITLITGIFSVKMMSYSVDCWSLYSVLWSYLHPNWRMIHSVILNILCMAKIVTNLKLRASSLQFIVRYPRASYRLAMGYSMLWLAAWHSCCQTKNTGFGTRSIWVESSFNICWAKFLSQCPLNLWCENNSPTFKCFCDM